MPILTKINGEPGSLRTMGWRFRVLADAIRWDVVTGVEATHQDSEQDWRDDAGEAFRERMYSGAKRASKLDTALEDFGKALELLADAFEMARQKMVGARATAIQGGLIATETHIQDPPPAVIETEHGQIDNRLGGAHDRMLEAYAQAEAEANVAEEILYSGWAVFRATADRAEAEHSFIAGDFTVGVARSLHATVRPILTNHVKIVEENARYVRSLIAANTNPSVDKKLWADYNKATAEAKAYQSRVSRAIKVGKGIKAGGWGLVVAGLGWDIYHGEAPSKAAFRASVGMVGAQYAERLVIALTIRTRDAGVGMRLGSTFGPLGTAVGGLLGGIGGAHAGGYLYDKGDLLFEFYAHEVKDLLESPSRYRPEEA